MGEAPGEVAGAAGDVEHSVAGDEAEQQTGDAMLVGHAGAQQALGHTAEGRAPPALVDHRDDAGEHEVLCDPGRGRIALGAQQVEVVARGRRFRVLGPRVRLEKGERALQRGRCDRGTGRGGHRSDGVVAGQRRKRIEIARLDVPARLPDVGQPVQTGDLALALYPRRVSDRQPADQLGDPVAQLEREVRSGGAHELTYVVDRDLVVALEAGGILGFAHGVVVVVVVVGVVLAFLGALDLDLDFDFGAGVFVGCCAVVPLTGAISSRVSIRAWSPTEMAPVSPTSQPWLYTPRTGSFS